MNDKIIRCPFCHELFCLSCNVDFCPTCGATREQIKKETERILNDEN